MESNESRRWFVVVAATLRHVEGHGARELYDESMMDDIQDAGDMRPQFHPYN